MKKLFLYILFFVFCKIGISQVAPIGTPYPTNQNLGRTATTLVSVNNIRFDQGLILGYFVDSVQANLLPYLKNYPYTIISVGNDVLLMRNWNATKWIKILLNAPVSPNDSTSYYWPLGYRLFPVIYDAFPPKIGTAGDLSFTIGTNGIDRIKVRADGLIPMSALNDSMVVINVNGELGKAPKGGGGGSVNLNQMALEVDHDETKSSNLWVQGAYEVGRLYKNCFYEFWVQPGDSAEYIFSSGYSGEHILLYGFSGGTTGKLMLAGNMWYNGSNIAGLNGQDTVLTNTVHVIAVAYDGTWITTYIDGVPSKRVAYTGYRSILSAPASVDMFIFGSDHSRFKGKGFKFRGFEFGTNPIPVSTTVPYYPKNVWQSSSGAYFQYDVTTVKSSITNDGQGDAGLKFTATLNSGANYNEWQNGGSTNPAYYPQWVQASMAQSAYSGSIPSVAGTPIIKETFHRQDRVPAFNQSPTLGSTEGGTAGVLTWTVSGGGYYGIIHNQAYGSAPNGYVHVNSTLANDSIIVTRGNGSEEDIVIIGRRADANNYLEFYVYGGFGYLREIVAGTPTGKGSFAMPGGWTKVTLVVKGNFAQVYTGVTKQINNADISTGSTSALGVGFGQNSSFVRISSFLCYQAL